MNQTLDGVDVMGGRRMMPSESYNLETDGPFFAFYGRKIIPHYACEMSFRQVVKYIDYPFDMRQQNAVFEILATRTKDGQQMVAFVVLHLCTYKAEQSWMVCQHTGFRPYTDADANQPRPMTHLFNSVEFEPECVCPVKK